MIQKYKMLFSNTIIFAIGSVGSRIITFLLVPLYTNVLTREQYGTADFIMTCSYLLVPVISFVIQDAVLRFGLSKTIEKGKVALNATVVFGVGIIGMFVILPFLSMFETLSEWKWYLFVLVISNNASNILFTYAKVKNKNIAYAIASIVQTLVLALVNIVALVFCHWGVKGYLLANICSNIIPTLGMVAYTHIISDMKESKFDKKLFFEMLKYSIPLIANSLSWWILNSSDRVMIQHYLSASDLGLYTAASKIPALLSIVTSIFANAWTISSITEYDSEQDKKFYSNIFSIFSLALNIGAVIIIAITKIFMKVYVGKQFYTAWHFVPFLIVGAIYFAYASFFGAIYDAAKKNIIVALTTFWAAALNISINFFLISKIGVLAASISTAIGYAAIGFYRMFNSRKYFSFPVNYKKTFLNASILVLQAILVTCDIAVYSISCLAFVCIIIINMSDIKGLINFIKEKLKF